MCLFPLSMILWDLIVDGTVISHLDDLKLYSKSEADMVIMVNTVRFFSEDIRLNIGFDKYTTFTINRGKVTNSEVLYYQEKLFRHCQFHLSISIWVC